jgi:hypothetical protein
MPEYRNSMVMIGDKFQDFESLDKYKYVVINMWNRDYPLPKLPENIIILEFITKYKFPLYNLPPSIKVLYFNFPYNYPLENLPINLYHLEMLGRSFTDVYTHPLHFLPESLKILNLCDAINQSSINLPYGLKSLSYSSNTFIEEAVLYTSELETCCMIDHVRPRIQNDSDKLEKYFNLINLPISLLILHLPNIKIYDLDRILSRLINLEELHIPSEFDNCILEYPPKLISLYVGSSYSYKLINLPASLKYIRLVSYYQYCITELADSNIEHIDLYDDKMISIINFLPKSLKKLTIIETHPELNMIQAQYPHLQIEKEYDYDHREYLNDLIRGEIW